MESRPSNSPTPKETALRRATGAAAAGKQAKEGEVKIQSGGRKSRAARSETRSRLLRIRLSPAELAQLRGAKSTKRLARWARHVLLATAARTRTNGPEAHEWHALICARVWLGALLDQLSRGGPSEKLSALEAAALLLHDQPETLAKDDA